MKTTDTATVSIGAAPTQSPEQQALREALGGLMSSVAKLGVALGLPYAAAEEMLRMAFVQAASRAHPGLPEHRKVSRISTTTGINRREVTRLVHQQSRPTQRDRSLASEVFTLWRTQQPFRGDDGMPRVLPRLGAAPSFEALAQAVTRDVHARSLLDELRRLGLVDWDETADTVAPLRDIFVPGGDRVRQIGFLGDNVGDHLRAAVDNVLQDDSLHFEQAVFADGLSTASLASMKPAVRAQWQSLLAQFVPALQACVQADAAVEPAAQGRVRIGLYAYQEDPAAPPPEPAPVRPVAKRRKPSDEPPAT